MSRVIEAVLTSENLRYLMSLALGAVLSFSTMWHSVNKNAFELKAQNERILNNVKLHDESKLILSDISRDLTEIKIMLARLENVNKNRHD